VSYAVPLPRCIRGVFFNFIHCRVREEENRERKKEIGIREGGQPAAYVEGQRMVVDGRAIKVVSEILNEAGVQCY
jgi:hypothetical protein